MDIFETIKNYQAIISLILLLAGGVFVMKLTLFRVGRTEKEVFDEKGSPRLVNKEELKVHQKECQDTICGKIDKLSESIDDLKVDAKEAEKVRLKHREEYHKTMTNISGFMGRVEQYMKDKSNV